MNQKMRKIYSFAVAAVAMFAAMSCAKEIVQDNQQAGMPDNDALTFVARVDGADDASETKSVLDGLKSYWNGEEKIWILDPRNETNDEGTFFNSSWKKGFTASAEKSETATFVEDDKTTSFEGETLMAVYPAGPAGGACWEGGESSVTGLWLSNEQTAVAGSYDPAAHIAIAQTSASSDLLEFKNVSSLLKFSVADNMEGEVKFISYKPSEGDAPRIAGNFSVDYNDGNPSVTPESGENKITFDAVALKGQFAVDNDYYMAILPANLAYGFAVQINGYTVKELAGESLTDEKFASLLDRKRNMILNLGTVSLNFGVCGTHTGWESDTPMSYDEASGLYVAQDVTFAAENNEFKIRPNGLWTTSVGTGGEIVLNAENDAYVGGGNSTIAAGTYDIWFDAGQKIIYAMSDGKTPGDIEYTSVVYLKPNANWNQSGARFAAYFYREGMQWVDMTDEDGDGIYECEVPEGTSRVIFCRMNPNVAENRWNSETDTEETKALWNQSADLKLPIDDTNCYTIAEDAWDKGEGSWSTLEDAKGTPEEPELVPSDVTVYLKPSVWASDSPWFAAYFFGADKSEWVRMTDTDSDGIYEAKVPYTIYTNVVFHRMNPASDAFDSTSVWNKTEDLTVPTDNNVCYIISGWGTETSTGSWKTLADAIDVWGICGDVTSWAEGKDITMDSRDGKFFANVTFPSAGNFKIRSNNDWAENYGLESTATVTAGFYYELVSNSSGNITIAAGSYDIWFDYDTKRIYVVSPGSSIANLKKGTPIAPSSDIWYLIGEFNSWTQKQADYKFTNEAGMFVLRNCKITKSGNAKINNGTWDVQRTGSFGGINGKFTLNTSGGDFYLPKGTYDIYLDDNNKVAYFLLPGNTPNTTGKYRFYIKNSTSQSNVVVHAWDGGYSTSWPGDTFSGKATVSGYGECYYKELNIGTQGITKFLVHNGSEGNKTADQDAGALVVLPSGDVLYEWK